MFEDKFKMTLKKGEEIKWSNNANVSASVLALLLPHFLLSLFICIFLTAPVVIITLAPADSDGNAWIPIVTYISLVLLANVILNIKAYANARNTYFCITNERIIKRSGAFNDKFVHYALKNVGNVEVSGSIFDKKGENGSSTLHVTSKDFHTDTHSKDLLSVRSLNNAYEAYRELTEITEGYNETLRVESK